MGCGGSKLDPNDEGVPPGIRPLLRQRFEELKKQGQSMVIRGQTLSKKELLTESIEEDDHSPHSLLDHGKKSLSKKDGSLDSAKVAPAPEPEDGRDHDNEYSEEEEEERERLIKAVTAGIERMILEDKHSEGEDEETDGQEGRLSSFDGTYMCPGSPSFRVYCIESLESVKDQGKDAGSNQKLPVDDGSMGAKSISLEGSMAKPEKKAKKGRKLRRVIPRGGPVKNFFNVKSCYTPGCGGNDNTHLLPEKAAA